MCGGNCSMNNHSLSINSIVIPVVVMGVVDMFFKLATLSPNVNIQVPLRIYMMILETVMVICIVDTFFNSHTLIQSDNSSSFTNIDGDIDKGDFSNGYGYINSHNYLQYNGLK